jgi:hypothetical protein
MDELSKQINEEGQKFVEQPVVEEDLEIATAVEGDEINNEEMQKGDALENLEYTDGKERDEKKNFLAQIRSARLKPLMCAYSDEDLIQCPEMKWRQWQRGLRLDIILRREIKRLNCCKLSILGPPLMGLFKQTLAKKRKKARGRRLSKNLKI